jgi:hypothetical protein
VEEAQEEVSAAQEKCTKLCVLTAVRNAKFLSNQGKALQFTAKIVTKKEKQLHKAVDIVFENKN